MIKAKNGRAIGGRLVAAAMPALAAIMLAACGAPQNAQTQDRQLPQQGAADTAADRSAVVGVWYGTASTVGTIELKADGSYTYGGSPAGDYSVVPGGILFTGSLAAWNGGKATLKNGSLEFYWTNAEGAKQWFSFAKGN